MPLSFKPHIIRNLPRFSGKSTHKVPCRDVLCNSFVSNSSTKERILLL